MSAQVFDAKYVEDVTTLAIEQAKATIEGVEQSLGLTVAGASEPKPEELAGFVFKMQAEFPPALYRYPDGHTVFASPWLLALEFCDNGAPWVTRFSNFISKHAGAA